MGSGNGFYAKFWSRKSLVEKILSWAKMPSRVKDFGLKMQYRSRRSWKTLLSSVFHIIVVIVVVIASDAYCFLLLSLLLLFVCVCVICLFRWTPGLEKSLFAWLFWPFSPKHPKAVGFFSLIFNVLGWLIDWLYLIEYYFLALWSFWSFWLKLFVCLIGWLIFCRVD